MKNVLVILGTRPEVIKLAPVILELKRYPEKYRVIICNTEQQKQLSNQTLAFFELVSDINLDCMQPNQTLSGLQSIILSKLSFVFDSYEIDATIVQGDTMSVFCGALSSFYKKVPVFHVEAGLRSFNLHEPFPEEAIRQMVSRVAAWHFAPTVFAKNALMNEGVSENKIVVTGNTVIDALSCLSEAVLLRAQKNIFNVGIDLSKPLVLVTIHRRENHGERLERILSVLKVLALNYANVQFVFPVHPNPNVKERVYAHFSGVMNVKLTNPLDYPDLVCIMKMASLILTDSGGIQEEAPTFSVPILVMRYETERYEGVEAGFAKLVGADEELILREASDVLNGKGIDWSRRRDKKNPYGDGLAAKRIRSLIDRFFSEN